VLSWWVDAGKPGQQQLALAMDASTLSDRFTVLCISVLYRGCAIPVAWVIVPAWGKGAWKPIWLDLFDLLAESVPSDWTVIVLADRGLYARWLYQHLQRLGWHPFLRINQGAKRVRSARTAIIGWPPLLRCQATAGVDRCSVLPRLPVVWIVP
jgi:hypothetical protein